MEDKYIVGVDSSNTVVVVARGSSIQHPNDSLTYYRVYTDGGVGIMVPISKYIDGSIVTKANNMTQGLDVTDTVVKAYPIDDTQGTDTQGTDTQ